MEGVTPRDPRSVNKGPIVIGIICAVTALSTVFAAARLFVRGKIKGKLLLDDYVIIISVLCTWLNVGFQVKSVWSRNGKHADMFTPEERADVIGWGRLGFAPGILLLGLPKFAVVALLTRLFCPSRAHRVFLWCLVWVCFIQLMVTVVLIFEECSEDETGSRPGKYCISLGVKTRFDIYTSAFSGFVDLYLTLYPTIVLSKLQLSLRKKLAFSAALGVGFVVEGSTSIIASCVPILKPLVDYIRSGFTMPDYSNKYRRHSPNTSREREQGRDIQLETIGQKRTRDIRAPDVDDAPCMSESQESILHWTQPSGGIVRTDHISISGEETKSDDMNIDIWNDGKRVQTLHDSSP
ncbi:hypothetical protein DL770_009711 [Monosporascus sp. CRB-9-2]|nr:hypothetical protein DL770_009711 [Monosporascus sp. CRB-9-2]